MRKILEEYFAGGLSGELIKLIQGWVSSKDHEQQKDAVLNKVWDRIVRPTGNPSEQAYKTYAALHKTLGFPGEPNSKLPILSQAAKKNVPLRRNMMLRAAAIFIPLVVAGTIGIMMLNRDAGNKNAIAQTTISATSGRVENATLPDSSLVSISVGSNVKYGDDFKNSRNVYLSGEAFFKVTHDAEHPFTVTSQHMTVTVLGTEFRMSDISGASRSWVALYEGSVMVDYMGAATKMEAGNKIEFDNATGQASLSKISVDELIVEGYKPSLQMENVTLGEIIKSIEANYGVDFVIPEGASLSGNYMAYYYDGQALKEVLELLEHITPGYNYRIENKKVIMIKTY